MSAPRYTYWAFYWEGEPTGVKRVELRRTTTITVMALDGWKSISYREYRRLVKLIGED